MQQLPPPSIAFGPGCDEMLATSPDLAPNTPPPTPAPVQLPPCRASVASPLSELLLRRHQAQLNLRLGDRYTNISSSDAVTDLRQVLILRCAAARVGERADEEMPLVAAPAEAPQDGAIALPSALAVAPSKAAGSSWLHSDGVLARAAATAAAAVCGLRGRAKPCAAVAPALPQAQLTTSESLLSEDSAATEEGQDAAAPSCDAAPRSSRKRCRLPMPLPLPLPMVPPVAMPLSPGESSQGDVEGDMQLDEQQFFDAPFAALGGHAAEPGEQHLSPCASYADMQSLALCTGAGAGAGAGVGSERWTRPLSALPFSAQMAVA